MIQKLLCRAAHSEPVQETQRVALHALARIYSLSEGVSLPPDLLSAPLFAAASRVTLMPWNDLRDAGYHLLEAAAGCPVALPVLCNASGVLDKLLDPVLTSGEEGEARTWR
eukprot:SAG31_NODE_585_length_13845_cov_25.623163_11_plen_111_part_00